ncbi:hypothetical protein B0I21_102280 [Sphingobacterium paludis]|uniref:Uncharacterized protein n=2 Tax=Sphingobacterium paludis TaxID=1476465 RepID=A0A4R7D4F4_9SPHI|nr:hypothetical protein B0I21_102280 [Sphingobacterium paludis]
MQYYVDLVKHFIIANSRHGTHSPFVYGLADQVIYKKANLGSVAVSFPSSFSWRYRKLLGAMLSHMGVNTLTTLYSEQPGAAIWIDPRHDPMANLFDLLEAGKIIIVHEPYRSKQLWNQWNADPRVIVSIDLFHVGLLLQRDGQRKENFLLRYPYWNDK